MARLLMLLIAFSLVPLSCGYAKELKFAVVPKFYSIFLIKAKRVVLTPPHKLKGLNASIADPNQVV